MTAVSCAEKSQGYPGAALHAPVHAHHQDHRARFSDPRRAAKIDSEETGHTGSAPRARGGSVRCVFRRGSADHASAKTTVNTIRGVFGVRARSRAWHPRYSK